MPKSANSSPGEASGCVSEVPLVWMISCSASHARSGAPHSPSRAACPRGPPARTCGRWRGWRCARWRAACRRSSFRTLHPGPQLLGVLAVPRRERQDLVGLVLAVAEHDVAVQVVALRHRGPLVADHRGEAARLVELVGGGGVLLPHRLHDRADDLRVLDRRRQRACSPAPISISRHLRGGFCPPSFIALPQRGERRVRHERRVALVDLRHHAPGPRRDR